MQDLNLAYKKLSLTSFKRLIFLSILMIQNNYFAQNDSLRLVKIDTINVVFEDWLYTMNNGEILYCGLPSDDELAFYSFRKIEKSDSIVYCKRVEKSNHSFSTGCYKLITIENNKLCWVSDGIWSFFNENGQLIKQELFNSRNHYELKSLKPFQVVINYLED